MDFRVLPLPHNFLAEGENTARAEVDNAVDYPVLDENFPRNVNAVTFADASKCKCL